MVVWLLVSLLCVTLDATSPLEQYFFDSQRVVEYATFNDTDGSFVKDLNIWWNKTSTVCPFSSQLTLKSPSPGVLSTRILQSRESNTTHKHMAIWVTFASVSAYDSRSDDFKWKTMPKFELCSRFLIS